MQRLLANLILGAIAAGLSATAGAEEPPPAYELRLISIFETPETEFVFVIGNSGFRTVEGLKDFLATRPAGTTLTWSPGCIRIGGEPLLSSESEMDEFKRFCVEHGIEFVLIPSG